MFRKPRTLEQLGIVALLAVLLVSPVLAEQWPQMKKKVIHAGYPADVKYVRQNIHKMQRLPFDGTIVDIWQLRPMFNHERKWYKRDLQSAFDDLAAIQWGKLTDNFLLLNASSKMDWFDDGHWENILHNIKLATEAMVVGKCKGLIFDPEQYGFLVWKYSAAAHHQTKTFQEYYQQARKRGVQWIQAVQSVKPDIRILNYYQLTAFTSYLRNPEQMAASTEENLTKSSYSMYLGFLNGMLDVAGPEVIFIDGNESAYYYASRANYDQAYVDIKQELLYLIAPENREKYKRQVQAGASTYVQGSLGMRNFSIQALGSFFPPAQRLKLFEFRTYHALRTTDEYVWCYADSVNINWWQGQVPAGAAQAIASAKMKIANRQPLGFSEEPFVEAKKKQANYAQDIIKSIVPRTAVIHKLGGAKEVPVIDGKLDDPIWRKVKPLEEFTVTKIFIKDKLDAPTRAQVTWDDEHLYIAYTCYEPKIQELHSSGKRDNGVYRGDSVEAFISLGENPWPYRQFIINPNNIQFDSVWREGKKMDKSWDAKWQSGAFVGKDRWTAELAIPWQAIGKKPELGETRRANLTRNRNPKPAESTTWTPMWKRFSDAEFFGTWTFDR